MIKKCDDKIIFFEEKSLGDFSDAILWLPNTAKKMPIFLYVKAVTLYAAKKAIIERAESKPKGKFGMSVGVKASCKNGMVRGADGKCVMSRPKFQKGGSFGMLSVKTGVDKNPNPTAADRIAGAKMNKKKIGGSIKRK